MQFSWKSMREDIDISFNLNFTAEIVIKKCKLNIFCFSTP